MTLTGAQLKTALEQQFKGCSLDFPEHKSANRTDHQILQVSDGFTYTWNPSGPNCEKVDAASIRLNGKTIEPSQKYRVTANGFLADGGDQMYEFTKGTDRVTGEQDIDAIVEYFQKRKTLSPGPLGRIKLAQPANAN